MILSLPVCHRFEAEFIVPILRTPLHAVKGSHWRKNSGGKARIDQRHADDDLDREIPMPFRYVLNSAT